MINLLNNRIELLTATLTTYMENTGEVTPWYDRVYARFNCDTGKLYPNISGGGNQEMFKFFEKESVTISFYNSTTGNWDIVVQDTDYFIIGKPEQVVQINIKNTMLAVPDKSIYTKMAMYRTIQFKMTISGSGSVHPLAVQNELERFVALISDKTGHSISVPGVSGFQNKEIMLDENLAAKAINGSAIRAYVVGDSYLDGQYVYSGLYMYLCTLDKVATFLAVTDDADFTLVGKIEFGQLRTDLDAETTRNDNQDATLAGHTTNLDVLNDFRLWDATRAYTTNSPVFSPTGKPYRAKQTTTNNNPDTDTTQTYWEPVGGGSGGGSKNFILNPLNKGPITDWTRSAGTALSWSTATPIAGGGALLISTLTTGQTVDGALNTVDPMDGGQSWKIDIGYYIDAGATYTDGQLSLVLLDGSTEISGGNVPIILGQVSTTSVYVYPTTNLAGLKVRLKCSGGTGTVRLAGVSVAPQQILSVPAISSEQPWTPVLSTGALGTTSENVAKWNRSTEFMDLSWRFKQTGAGTIGSGSYLITIPDSKTIDLTRKPVGSVVGYGKISDVANEQSVTTNPIVVVVSSATQLRIETLVSEQALPWSNVRFALNNVSLNLSFTATIPISQWTGSNTIQVSGEDVEYASNSDVTATTNPNSDGGLASCINGFGNAGTFGAGWTTGASYTRRVKFKSPIKWGVDSIHLFIKETVSGKTFDITLSQTTIIRQATSQSFDYGYFFDPVPSDLYSMYVVFPSGGRAVSSAFNAVGLSFSGLGANYTWWIEKRSGGSLAQVPPGMYAPVGALQMFAGAITQTVSAGLVTSNAPSSWFLCNGDAISRSVYKKIYDVIGTTYGVGDGSTTFNLPDMRAAAPVGAGTSVGYTQNETIALGSKLNDQFQGHRMSSLHTNFITDGVILPGTGSGGLKGSYTDPTTGDPITDGTNGTPRVGSVTRGKSVGVNYIIKVL